MLYILTGDIQTGKTRWLQGLIEELEARDVIPYGVIAPGRWIEHRDGGSVAFAKTGIDNELLPSHELIAFARRSSDVSDDEAQRTCSQARNAQLSWAIDDGALNRVDEHLARVARMTAPSPDGEVAAERISSVEGNPTADVRAQQKGILVIDELGRLELLHGKGLANALALVERGATPALPHALIIVREQLLDQARARFADAPWEGTRAIFPTRDAREELLAAFCS